MAVELGKMDGETKVKLTGLTDVEEGWNGASGGKGGAAGGLCIWLSAWRCGWRGGGRLGGSEFGPQKVFWT